MRKIKAISALVLAIVLTFSLAACGISEEAAVGVWEGEYEYNGNEFFVSFELTDEGTYGKVTFKNGEKSSTESGTYTVEGGEVILSPEGKDNTTHYKYKAGALVNNGHKFVKR